MLRYRVAILLGLVLMLASACNRSLPHPFGASAPRPTLTPTTPPRPTFTPPQLIVTPSADTARVGESIRVELTVLNLGIPRFTFRIDDIDLLTQTPDPASATESEPIFTVHYPNGTPSPSQTQLVIELIAMRPGTAHITISVNGEGGNSRTGFSWMGVNDTLTLTVLP